MNNNGDRIYQINTSLRIIVGQTTPDNVEYRNERWMLPSVVVGRDVFNITRSEVARIIRYARAEGRTIIRKRPFWYAIEKAS